MTSLHPTGWHLGRLWQITVSMLPHQLTTLSIWQLEQLTDTSKYTSCYLSQFKQATGEPSKPAQEINPVTYLL